MPKSATTKSKTEEMSVTEKSGSDNNINLVGQSLNVTPPKFVFSRAKRPREEDFVGQFSAFKEEIRNMITSLIAEQEKELKNLFTPTLSDIKKSNENIESSIGLLSRQHEDLAKKMLSLEQQSAKYREDILILESKIEDMQRAQRKSNLEMKNVPKSNNETKDDLINMVLHLGKSINCCIVKNDIRDIYRVRSKKDGQINTPIVVELASTILKTDMLKMCKAFNIKYKSKLRAKHLGFTKNEETNVFVAEQLTTKASRLFYLARDLAKSKGYKFCWTSYGRVYVRMNENTPIVSINSELQINSLFRSA